MNTTIRTGRGRWAWGLLGVWLVGGALPAEGGASQTIREAVESGMRNFARKLGNETAESLTTRLTRLAELHGDDAVEAFRRVGPDSLRYAEEAGEHAGTTLRLLARHGEEARWIIRNADRLALAARYGDEAAVAMLRHGGVAEPLLSQFGTAAARALNQLNGQQARRLAMMAANGDLNQAGKATELLAVIEKHGGRAMDFIWDHKKELALAAVLVAFIADPAPFLNGTRDLADLAFETAGAVAGTALAPVAEAAGDAVREAARNVQWTWVVIVILTMTVGLLSLRGWRRRRSKTTPAFARARA